jgi:DNA-binding PadR family transcriptional regulator
MSLARTLIGLLEDRPRYGYELKHLYDDRFGGSQEVKFGQVYTTLARLRRDGLVDIAAVESGAGPERKLHVVTPAGVADLERWLGEPEPPETYGRKVLFSKVVLALMSGRPADEIRDLIAEIAADEASTREWMKPFAALTAQLTGELSESDVARAMTDPAAFQVLMRRCAAMCLAAEGGAR